LIELTYSSLKLTEPDQWVPD